MEFHFNCHAIFLFDFERDDDHLSFGTTDYNVSLLSCVGIVIHCSSGFFSLLCAVFVVPKIYNTIHTNILVYHHWFYYYYLFIYIILLWIVFIGAATNIMFIYSSYIHFQGDVAIMKMHIYVYVCAGLTAPSLPVLRSLDLFNLDSHVNVSITFLEHAEICTCSIRVHIHAMIIINILICL